MTSEPRPIASESPLMAWMRLVRLPNVFTLIADVSAAFALVMGGTAALRNAQQQMTGIDFAETAFQVGVDYTLLILAAVSLYWGGMVLNDVFDVRRDARLRPSRPLPRRDISLATARRLGMVMLILGVMLAGACSAMVGGIALLLAVLIIAYDGPGKSFWFAPVLMGGCRMLSFLLGAAAALSSLSPEILGDVGVDSTATPSGPLSMGPLSMGPLSMGPLGDATALGLPAVCIAFAAGMGVYIAGVTTFARREAIGDRSVHLGIGWLLMILGGLIVATAPRWGFVGSAWQWSSRPVAGGWYLDARIIFPAAILILFLPVWRRALVAWQNPSSGAIGLAIRAALLAIIPISAVITFLAVGPIWAACVLALLFPSLVLAQKFAVT